LDEAASKGVSIKIFNAQGAAPDLLSRRHILVLIWKEQKTAAVYAKVLINI
jgi:hypothetical protein